MTGSANRILYVYWGRRGSLSQIALEIAGHLREPEATLSFSTGNELANRLAALAPVTRPFTTFDTGSGAIRGLLRARRQIDALVRGAEAEGVGAIVVLMSHVWTPLLGARLRHSPIRYVVIAHDASRHPGDRTGLVLGWLRRDLRYTDRIVTLTRAVADQLTRQWGIAADRIRTVPHPVLGYGAGAPRPERAGPLRILFLGRIMAYKGLDLLAEAVRELKAAGRNLQLGVFGEGEIGEARPKLEAMSAEIVNRWIDHAEIGEVLARHDVLVLPYREASQSGVAAAARSAGLPVIVTPIGGLTEQVSDGVDGLIAANVSAGAIADCLARLDDDRALLAALAQGSATSASAISVGAFEAALRAIALEGSG